MKVPTILNRENLFAVAASLLVWQCIAYLHLMAGYLDAVSYRPEHRLSANDYVYYFLAYSSWALFSVVLLKLLQWQSTSTRKIRFLMVYLVGLALWLPSYFLIDYAINAYIQQTPVSGAIDSLLNTPNALVFLYTVIYSLTFGVCTSMVLYKEAKKAKFDAMQLSAQRAEIELTMTRQHLQLLRSQLGPHFLFNCLGAISGLARAAEKDALLSAIARVGNLLRFSVEASQSDKIVLQEELDFVADYIALQTLRFDDRFDYQFHSNIGDANYLIPPFLIQPLIENVFTHAVANTQKFIQIELNIHAIDKQLHFILTNTHVGSDVDPIGLQSSFANLQARLQAAYHDRFQLHSTIKQDLYVCEVILPVDDLTS